jgi:hypothetical protein
MPDRFNGYFVLLCCSVQRSKWASYMDLHAMLISPRKGGGPGSWAAECDGGGVDQKMKMDDRVGIYVGMAVVILEHVATYIIQKV